MTQPAGCSCAYGKPRFAKGPAVYARRDPACVQHRHLADAKEREKIWKEQRAEKAPKPPP